MRSKSQLHRNALAASWTRFPPPALVQLHTTIFSFNHVGNAMPTGRVSDNIELHVSELDTIAGSRSDEVSSTDISSRVVGPDHTVALVVGEDGVNANLAVVGTFANDKLATIK